MTSPLPDQARESWDLSNEEKVELARKRKERGNALFKASKWAQAVKKYKSAAEAVGYDVRRSPYAIQSCVSEPLMCSHALHTIYQEPSDHPC